MRPEASPAVSWLGLVERRSRVEDLPGTDLLRDDRHAIALLREARRAHGDEISGALRDDLLRRAVRALEMMDEADRLAALYFGAEIHGDLEDAGLWREQVVL